MFLAGGEFPTLQYALAPYLKTKRVSQHQLDVYQYQIGTCFVRFAEGKGKLFVENVDLILIKHLEFELRKTNGALTQRKILSKVKKFLEYCLAHGWLTRVPPFPKIEVSDSEPNPSTKNRTRIFSRPSVASSNPRTSCGAVGVRLVPSALSASGCIASFSCSGGRGRRQSTPSAFAGTR